MKVFSFNSVVMLSSSFSDVGVVGWGDGAGPTALAVGAGGGCLDIFLSSIVSLFFLPFSARRLDID